MASERPSRRERRGTPRSAWPRGRILLWITAQVGVAVAIVALGIWLLKISSRISH